MSNSRYLKANIQMIMMEHIQKELGTILYKKMIWENML